MVRIVEIPGIPGHQDWIFNGYWVYATEQVLLSATKMQSIELSFNHVIFCETKSAALKKSSPLTFDFA